MAPWSFRKKKGHGADAVAEGEAKPGSTSANEASDKGSVKPPAIARAPSSSRHKHKPHDLVKLSRPPVSFLFALFLNQLYINLILLVPRQVGIYIIRTRFLPQDDPAAQLTGERGEEEVSSFFRGRPRGGVNSPLSEGAKRPPEEEKTHLSSRFFLFPFSLSSRIKKPPQPA